MGCIFKCHEKCKNKYMQKEDQEHKDFEKVNLLTFLLMAPQDNTNM